ncbi:hypothetical protein [Puia dinghuensis]|uniref:Uncharacterized protein n=1 Tax=Puia dinghuensis TaxID=1792502 RepID=A0A8J2XUK5_9BACT|nr:hypothetical protein [Puia dinghuensis]GGB08107.1 hypothetical protein GCM10011511_34570 [Puia dinghuensis]
MARVRSKDTPSIAEKRAISVEQELTEGSISSTDEIVVEEEKDLDRQQVEGFRKVKLKNDLLEAQLNKLKGDNTARKTHNILIFIMVFFWLVAVISILILVGMGKLVLSDKVLITLLSTTSVNIIGLLVIVANYLFNKSKST